MLKKIFEFLTAIYVILIFGTTSYIIAITKYFGIKEEFFWIFFILFCTSLGVISLIIRKKITFPIFKKETQEKYFGFGVFTLLLILLTVFTPFLIIIIISGIILQYLGKETMILFSLIAISLSFFLLSFYLKRIAHWILKRALIWSEIY